MSKTIVKSNNRITIRPRTKETREIRNKKVRYIVKDFETRYHECGDKIEYTGHPKKDCKYGCTNCGLANNMFDSKDEENCDVEVVFIGTEEYFRNIENNELYLIPKGPNYRNVNKQTVIGYSIKDNIYSNKKLHLLNQAKHKLIRNRKTRYVVNQLKYPHPEGTCVYGCGDCNPACDDDDNGEEHEVLVDVIKLDGKDYFVDIHTKEIHELLERKFTNYRYNNKQVILGIADIFDETYTFF